MRQLIITPNLAPETVTRLGKWTIPLIGMIFTTYPLHPPPLSVSLLPHVLLRRRKASTSTCLSMFLLYQSVGRRRAANTISVRSCYRLCAILNGPQGAQREAVWDCFVAAVTGSEDVRRCHVT